MSFLLSLPASSSPSSHPNSVTPKLPTTHSHLCLPRSWGYGFCTFRFGFFGAGSVGLLVCSFSGLLFCSVQYDRCSWFRGFRRSSVQGWFDFGRVWDGFGGGFSFNFFFGFFRCPSKGGSAGCDRMSLPWWEQLRVGILFCLRLAPNCWSWRRPSRVRRRKIKSIPPEDLQPTLKICMDRLQSTFICGRVEQFSWKKMKTEEVEASQQTCGRRENSFLWI
jgi:hypothetical protein